MKGDRCFRIRCAALIALLLLVAAVGCDRAPSGSILRPTGAPDDPDDPGGGDGPYVSPFAAIQVVGDFNNWDTGVPSMTIDSAGVWSDTLTVQIGCYLMKFRTDDDWDTANFVRCAGDEEDCQVQVPADATALSEDVCLSAESSGNAIGQVEFVENGSYLFELDEPGEVYRISKLENVGSIAGLVAFSTRGSLPVATISVLESGSQTEVVEVTSDPDDGSFLAEGLAPGDYDINVAAAGYEAETVQDITVVALQVTDVGTVTLSPGCSYAFTEIQAIGEFNGWNTSTPSMTQIGSCVWADTLNMAVGCYYMKFRTDLNWDNPPDFGRCTGSETDCQIPIPADGTAWTDSACVAAPGADAIGQIDIMAPGDYVFLFDEAGPSYSIRKLDIGPTGSIAGTVAFNDNPSSPPVATVTVFEAGTSNVKGTDTTNPADGIFVVRGLVSGTYDVTVEAPAYFPETVTDQVVVSPDTTDVGTVTLQPGYTQIQVVGDFNGYDENTPPMTRIDDCVWVEILNIPAGCYTMKFRTNGDWDETPDFGRCSGTDGPCQVQVPLDGSPLTDTTCAATGTGTAIGEVQFLADGEYVFLFDECGPSYSIRSEVPIPVGSISGEVAFSNSPSPSPAATVTVFEGGTSNVVATDTTDPADNLFLFQFLPAGSYDVGFQAPNYADSLVTGVIVTPPGDTDIGTVTLQFSCTSALTTVDVWLVGSFSGLVTQEPLTQIQPCVWADTLSLAVDCYGVRFPTSDPLRDYRRCTGFEGLCETPIPGDGSTYFGNTCFLSSGGLLGELEIVTPGDYEVILDEGAAPPGEAVFTFRKLP